MVKDFPTVRDYLESDANSLWPLLAQGLAAYGLAPDAETTDRDLLNVRESYIERGGRFRLLVDDTRVLGMYGLFNEGNGVAELRKMYLDRQCKGRGYGKLLLEDAIKTARDSGFTRIVLETNKVLVEAIGLYTKYGFSETQSNHLSARCDIAMAMNL